MKLLIFSLLLCLGASLKGQTSTDQTVCSLPNTIATGHWACPNALIASNNCFCRPDPAIPAASKLRHKRTFNSIAISPKFTEDSFTPPLPVDVPAIQKKDDRIFYCGQGGPRCDHGEHFDKPDGFATMCRDDAASQKLENSCGKTRWMCPDPHNYALLTSVDGTNRVCRRISQ